jgi:hypothetical protein
MIGNASRTRLAVKLVDALGRTKPVSFHQGIRSVISPLATRWPFYSVLKERILRQAATPHPSIRVLFWASSLSNEQTHRASRT